MVATLRRGALYTKIYRIGGRCVSRLVSSCMELFRVSLLRIRIFLFMRFSQTVELQIYLQPPNIRFRRRVRRRGQLDRIWARWTVGPDGQWAMTGQRGRLWGT